jgi:hypothetical protein
MLNEKQKVLILNLVSDFRVSTKELLEMIKSKSQEAFDLEMQDPNGIMNVLSQIEYLVNNGKLENNYNNVNKVKETLLNIKYSAKLANVDATKTRLSSFDYCYRLLTDHFIEIEESYNEAFHVMYLMLEKFKK